MSAVTKLASLPPIARRAIALSMLASALLGAWVAVMMPLRAVVTSQSQWREDVTRAIARDRGMLGAAQEIRAAAAALDASPLRAGFYESGEVPVADAIQNDLQTALLSSGVEPTNFKVLPAATQHGLRAHRIEFATVMTVDQLQAFFISLEQQPRYLRVERLRLDAPAEQRSDENPRVNALMEVRGYSVDGPVPQVRVARAN